MDDLFVLSNGITIPAICFGGGIVHTYRHKDESIVNYMKYRASTFLKNKKQYYLDKHFKRSIKISMENGITMFDTSKAYRDAEFELGKTLKNYNRDSYFVVTKASNKEQYNGNMRKALEESLKQLKMNYVDLYLLHWPVEGVWRDNWRQLETLYKEGLCRSIGVCNCNIHHLEELKNQCEIFPMINEFECHPLFTQDELRDYCKNNNVQVMAYTSTARMDERLRKTALVPIANKYQKNIVQVILRWHIQIGNIPIFNSTNPQHIAQNSNINDFVLSDEEIQQISSININSRLRYDPDNCDFKQL